MRRKHAAVIMTVLFVFCLLSQAVSAAGSDIYFDVELSARAAYVVNKDTGIVVYEKNADERMSPASCTKIMSAALAMEMCDDLDTVVTVPYGIWNEFDGIDISNAGLQGGEELTMHDLICCMLVQSANEAASVVADFFGRETFISAMNEKARELGCTNTHFSNPHGLYADDHYTTAKDLYRITMWALEKEEFWEITCCNRYTLPATNKHNSRDLISTNKLQEPTSGYYTSYIRGIKTGTTTESGRCLVSAAVKNDLTFISVLLGCPLDADGRVWEYGNSSYTDARLIYDWCFSNLSVKDVTDSGTAIAEVPLKYAKQRDHLLLYSSGQVATLLDRNNDESVVIRYETQVPEFVTTPVEVGQVIGTADVYCDDIYLGTVDLVAKETIKRNIFFFLLDILGAVLSSKVAIVIYLLLVLLCGAYVYYISVMVPRMERELREKRKR